MVGLDINLNRRGTDLRGRVGGAILGWQVAGTVLPKSLHCRLGGARFGQRLEGRLEGRSLVGKHWSLLFGRQSSAAFRLNYEEDIMLTGNLGLYTVAIRLRGGYCPLIALIIAFAARFFLKRQFGGPP